jgi:hypothetical protein
VAGVVGQTDPVQLFERLSPCLGFASADGPEPEGHTVGGGQVGKEEVVLEDDPDGPALGWQPAAGFGVVQNQVVDADPPDLEGTRPARALSRVVLPAPLGPMTATISPLVRVSSALRVKVPRTSWMQASRLTCRPATGPASRPGLVVPGDRKGGRYVTNVVLVRLGSADQIED